MRARMLWLRRRQPAMKCVLPMMMLLLVWLLLTLLLLLLLMTKVKLQALEQDCRPQRAPTG